MDTEKIKELMFLHKFEALEADELGILESFKAEHPDLYKAFAIACDEKYNLLALSIDIPVQSPLTKSTLLKKIKSETQNGKRGSVTQVIAKTLSYRQWGGQYIGAFLLLLIIGYSVHQYRELESREKMVDLLMQKNQVFDEFFNSFSPAEYAEFNLQSNSNQLQKKAKVYLSNDKGKGMFQTENISPASDDKDYQLWVVKKDQHINAGVIHVTANDSLIYHPLKDLPITDLVEIDAVVITIEPKGGVDIPSGEQILIGVQTPKEH